MTEKDAFRADIRARTAALSLVYLADSDRGILKNLIALPEFQSAKRVFLYISFGREVDTRSLIDLCRKLKKPVAAPTNLDAGKMDFALLERPLSELPTGVYGIPQPPNDAPRLTPEAGDVVIVPALCYDKALYRLGRGGGYYDRFLADCPAFKIGLCREALLAEQVPREPHDQRVDCLITEKKTARP
ncbi:MAG: 5-formyltetrahydrofolate cyclo-ligase [Oscillospiraceae bacterium]|jgi:5-formyltetrahydrofolate cyclo-ligase